MNKKIITLAALVLVVALIGGIFWYTNQPVPVEGPAEDEEIPASSEAAESTPETEDSEAEENTPETEGDSEAVENNTEIEGDGDGDVYYNEETGEIEFIQGTGPLSEQLGLSEDMTEEEVQQFLEDAKKALEESASSVADGTNQQQQGQGQGQGQQGQQGQGQGQGQGQQSGGKMTREEVLKKLQDAGINAGGKPEGFKGSNGGVDGSEVHW